MLSPSLNIDRITSTTRLVNSRTEGSQTEWALVLLTMSAIEAFSIGFSVAAAWTIPMQFMKGHVSTATLYIVPSIAHAIVSNILKVMLLAVAKKYTGVFAEQKLEGTTQIGSYVLDVLTGATGVGGAYVIAHGMEDWPTGNMSIPVIFAIFLIGFFLQPLLKLILSGAWLKITYQIERSSIEVLYEIFYTDSSVESETTSQLVQHSSEDHNNTKTFLLLVLILNKEFKAMLSLRYFLTKYLNVAVAFSIYSPVGAKIAVWWVGRFNNQYPGILSMIQITWFFAEFAVVDALIIQIAKYILPYEAPTHDIATNFFRASNDNILVPDVSEQGSN